MTAGAIVILTAPIWLPLALLVIYAIVIQYERGGLWVFLVPFAGVAAIIDGVLAHTLFAVYVWDYPRAGEWTFSQQLGRLVTETGRRGRLARAIAVVLDRLAPSGKHIHPRQ